MDNNNMQKVAKTSEGLDIVAGVWVFLSPFIFRFSDIPSALWTNLIAGAIVIILASIRLSDQGSKMTWPSWVNVIVGVWLLISPFMLNLSATPAFMWNNVILGIIIMVLGTSSALSNPHSKGSTPHDMAHMHR